MNRLCSVSLAVSLIICLAAAPLSCRAEKPSPRNIRIGLIQSLTGIAAEDGRTVVQAIQLATEDYNSKGANKVDLLIEDDGTQSKNSISALEKLSAQGVDAIVGATWDFTTNPILQLAGRKGIVIFNTSNLIEALSISETRGFGFINSITAKNEAKSFEKFLSKNSFKTLAIIYANNSWGETQLRVYRELAVKSGLDITDQFYPVSYDANEWNLSILRIRQKNPDLVLLLLNKNDLEVFLRKASELRYKPSFFASKNLYDALIATSSKEHFDGTCFTYPMEQLEGQSEFRKRYKNHFGEEPRIYADSSYDALFIITSAIERSQSTGLSIKDTLRTVSYDGLAGNYRFSENTSFTTGKSSLVCVRNEEPVIEK